ncbi:sigma-54 interaction domain-containing protein [Marinobacter sp. SS21]|uniref:sigma-54 interaction domain-containing protein n=1 Tax=Marinobacter sp. SS21 TaxID=2979460 RepID=UPI00232BDC6F|nr:sigma 54-interacting transcriptional regulator [Marinobacter sp. SS21]MDC0662905.1 sigma 54-interacting transcriptional regulator [Marinobacter sp. SS21]
MQTELHSDIELALELVRQADLGALLATAAKQIEQAFGVSRCWLFALEPSGRALNGVGDAVDRSFACDDFSHPFAHVLQQGQGRELSRDACYRLDQPEFQALLEVSRRPRSIWLQPVFGDGERLLGVAMLCASDPTHWRSVLARPLFRGLLNLLGCRWQQALEQSDQAWQRRYLKRSLDQLHNSEAVRSRSEQLAATLVGPSEPMSELRAQIVRAAGSQLSVLVQGETGCGKDLVARGLHDYSARASGPFVVVNCAAIPDSLLESELFGHAKGAFSGADRSKQGLLAQANGGTLFLDEIGDMPLALQSKLLRVLETRQFRPLGAQQEERSDFRLVAATHQPLQARIGEGHFRRDLFYRLSQVPLKVIPLRQRIADLEPLCRHFIRLYQQREGQGPMGISSQALRQLADYRFPGNVRELRNVIEYACLQTPPGDDIQPEALWLDLLCAPEPDEGAIGFQGITDTPTGVPMLRDIDNLREAAQAFEAAVIADRLRAFGGNRALAADSLGLPKRTLAHKCQKYNVSEA